MLLVGLVGEAVFMEKTPFRGSNYPLEFLAIIPLLWAAFRLGERGAVTCSALMSVIAWYGTRHSLGPFARPGCERIADTAPNIQRHDHSNVAGIGINTG